MSNRHQPVTGAGIVRDAGIGQQVRARRHAELLVQGGTILTTSNAECIDLACADGCVVAPGDLQTTWSAEATLDAAGTHMLHVSTTEEMAFLAQHKRRVISEVTPCHQTMHSPERFDELESTAQMTSAAGSHAGAVRAALLCHRR